ncbi:uncharacterized protein A1O9_12458 [Exophiala aquamarina CBS 119918]|uniref:Cytochrome P450 n=1 Tax=Exophiala aquamarina CBS 119918 TaxID=1182545 RepID=A0A072NV80_9EURO|nr:uncharacterized protein A1O9_12458 [Exophiala aquamarina CBS 119918]KEF51541.1 hypothetical protein A1O9_12458 [Exophiala aquamarina CBS 119918]
MVSRLNQSLSFHSSPESFISSRLEHLSYLNSEVLPASPGVGVRKLRPIIRASILNRNVHIVSSYRLCEAILKFGSASGGSDFSQIDQEPSHQEEVAAILVAAVSGPSNGDEPVFTARLAYAQFMSAFFPGPNVLLEDGPQHAAHRERWKQQLKHIPEISQSMIRSLTVKRLIEPLQGAKSTNEGKSIDLYSAMKSLAWDLLFGIFLGLDRNENGAVFSELERSQVDLLQGQFSLFPVSIKTPFWSSPRSKGLDAVKNVNGILRKRLRQVGHAGDTGARRSTCPFMQRFREREQEETPLTDEDVVSHTLLFTSSLVNKALASLLTAYLLNLFMWRDGVDRTSGGGLADLIRSQEDRPMAQRMLESILSETERLSPPIVGVMRRVTQDIVLRGATDQKAQDETSDCLVRQGEDVWLYLAGAGRDNDVFEGADQFVWDRFMSCEDSHEAGHTFGRGTKTCMGYALVRQICLTVASSILDSTISFRGVVSEQGVRHWLGWEKDVPHEVVARDVKQLPSQRPRRPVNVEVILGKSPSETQSP